MTTLDSGSDVIPGAPRAVGSGSPDSMPLGPLLGHRYGERVHIYDCPWINAALARLSGLDVTYTELVSLVRAVTTRLATDAFGRELPRARRTQTTRMSEQHGPLGVWRGEGFDPAMRVAVVDVIRGGMIPAQTCFELLCLVHPIEHLRLDHLNMQRIEGDDGHVERVDLSGSKIGGSVEGATVVIPDPMGATGATIQRAYRHLCEHHGQPRKLVVLPLIATPQFLRTVLDLGPEVSVWAGRLDRGMSSPDVLDTVPGTRWDEESGLDAHDYIVPGAGGLGELLSHSWA